MTSPDPGQSDRAAGQRPPQSPRRPQTLQPAGPGEALRLTYEYEGDTVRLISQQRVRLTVHLAGAPQAFVAPHAVDVVDADGATLVRIPVHADLGLVTEVFDLPGRPIVRLPDDHRKGAFSVIVPIPREAARAVLLRLRPDQAPAADDPGLRPAGPGPSATTETTVILSDDQIEW